MPSKRHFVRNALHVAIPVVILGWLVVRLLRDEPHAVQELYARPKDWLRLVAAFGVYFAAILLTFVRWYWLVRCLRLPFRVMDAIRLGFVGYLFQFVGPGMVGGDLFKAWFIVREHPERRPEAVATIVVDRMVGLLGLSILASLCFLFATHREWLDRFAALRDAVYIATVIGVGVFLLLLGTRLSLEPLARRWQRLPSLQGALIRVQRALDYYRTHRGWVVVALLASVVNHLLQATAIFLAATAVFPDAPGWLSQQMMWVFSAAAGSLPLSPGGLGTFDLAYSFLYGEIDPTGGANQGFLVAILFRLMCISVALCGVVIYLSMRRATRAAGEEFTTSIATCAKGPT